MLHHGKIVGVRSVSDDFSEIWFDHHELFINNNADLYVDCFNDEFVVLCDSDIKLLIHLTVFSDYFLELDIPIIKQSGYGCVIHKFPDSTLFRDRLSLAIVKFGPSLFRVNLFLNDLGFVHSFNSCQLSRHKIFV